MSDKQKFPLAQAAKVALEIVFQLNGVCDQIIVAGSVRRRAEKIGDIEILYIPRLGPGKAAGEMFLSQIDLADAKIGALVDSGFFTMRKTVNGSFTFGPKNKLLRHAASNIPIDLFATDARCWWNYLVCRTGPAAFNIRVAQRARELGWRWHPYGPGFSHDRPGTIPDVEWRCVRSEEELFEFLGWHFLQPGVRGLVDPLTGVEPGKTPGCGPAQVISQAGAAGIPASGGKT